MFAERIGLSVATQKRRKTLLVSSAVIGTLLIGPSVSACSSEKPLHQPFTTSNQEYNKCETLRSIVMPYSLPAPSSINQLLSQDTVAWNPAREALSQWEQQFTADKYKNLAIVYSLGLDIGYRENTHEASSQAYELGEQILDNATQALAITNRSKPYVHYDQTGQSHPLLSVVANAYLC